MHYFAYKNDRLFCEDVEVVRLAQRYGTPLYVYSRRTIVEHFKKLQIALRSLRPLICYSVKANGNLSLLKLLTGMGSGLDVVSGGELFRAQKAGCRGDRIVYASVGKTAAEIRAALAYGVLMFNVESLPELAAIERIAGEMKKTVRVALRVNPDVEAKTHRYITTGKKDNKFGIDFDIARKIFLSRASYRHLNICGVHLHIGSQITEGGPFVAALKRVVKFIAQLQKDGVGIESLNIGGGLGIIYSQETPQTAQQFADRVVPILKPLGLKIILEPGRFIVGNAGALAARVTYVKEAGRKTFLITDAAMNDLIRPALYDAYHTISDCNRRPDAARRPVDVVGPVCESADFLGLNRRLAACAGEYLAVLGAGAYGFSMSSNYNARPRAAEVLVSGGKAVLIGRRETYDDLITREKL